MELRRSGAVGRPLTRARGIRVPEHFADAHIQRFLATKEVVLLACVQPDGSPLAMPVWFLHGLEDLTIVSVADTQKVRNLRRDPRVCVVAEAGTRGDARGVIVRGRAEFLPDTPERLERVRALLQKYNPDLGRLWGGTAMPPDRALIRIVPSRVRSWGLSPK
jgi:PPOX class probable F420-dependent enzyme